MIDVCKMHDELKKVTAERDKLKAEVEELRKENLNKGQHLLELKVIINEIAKTLGTNEADGWNCITIIEDIDNLKTLNAELLKALKVMITAKNINNLGWIDDAEKLAKSALAKAEEEK